MKNLTSNTQYFMVVTAIDSAGNESEPSNELKFKTKNLPPERPEGITREIKNSKVVVRWREAIDPDGRVKGYNIYRADDNSKIATVKSPEFTVPKGVSVYKIKIAAQDDLGSESDMVRVFMPKQLVVSAAPSVFVIRGDLGELFGPGYGGQLSMGLRNIYYQNFEAGLNLGYYAFKGKEEENTDSMFMIPVTAYAGRITSYNVCYTKLLRNMIVAAEMKFEPGPFDLAVRQAMKIPNLADKLVPA